MDIKKELPQVSKLKAEKPPQKIKAKSKKVGKATVKDTFSSSGAIKSGKIRYTLPTPIELTPHKMTLAAPSSRVDVVKDVLGLDKVWKKGITGKGVGVAVIDTGVYPHPDLKGRIVAFKDFVNGKTEPYDDNGHGTHVSGLVAGNGSKANNSYKGAAPEANIIGVKVLSGQGGGSLADIIKGIQWTIDNKEQYNIKVVNLSLGAPSHLKAKDDLVALAIKKLSEAGIVPMIAAGNSGPWVETIGTPAISTHATTVGAFDDKNNPDKKAGIVAFFSSRGPTTRDRNVKPDIISPGVSMVSLRSPRSMLDEENVPHLGDYYVLLSGTSMATPVAAGVVADMLEANPDLTPNQVKDILMKTADKMPEVNPTMQGAGLVNPYQAVKQALELKDSRN